MSLSVTIVGVSPAMHRCSVAAPGMRRSSLVCRAPSRRLGQKSVCKQLADASFHPESIYKLEKGASFTNSNMKAFERRSQLQNTFYNLLKATFLVHDT